MSRTATLLLSLVLLAPLARAEDPPEKKPHVSLADFEDAFLEVADRVRPGVVSIEVHHAGERPEFARDVLFSGVAWDASGTIVAIGRDLESASEILVSPVEGDPVKAHFVGLDDETGICVLRLESAMPAHLKALEHGPADQLRAGSFCVAVGNPVGLHHSVAFGHVAATGRTIRRGSFTTKDAIQLTLPVNPGDPGGLLADSRGRLVGVLSSSIRRPDSGAGASPERDILRQLFERVRKGRDQGDKGDNKGDDLDRALREALRAFEPNIPVLTQNVSFAIPADAVARAVERVLANGGKPWLGVDVRDLRTLQQSEREGLGITIDRGLLVTGVRVGGPASKADLHENDVIVSWNGEAVKSARSLQKVVRETVVGSSVKIELLRGKERITVDVKIEARGDAPPPPGKPEEKQP
jgi:serine protease Do